MTESSIDVSGVSFRYPEASILEKITLHATPGTVTTLAGPNGCGKTTLLRLISGHLKPREGTIACAGISVPDSSPADIARVLGYVPQSSPGSFPFSVLDMVLCGRMPYLQPWEQPKADDLSIARDCLHRLGIGDLADNIWTRLSGGEKQMVLIARALCQDPSVLLLDEPTSSLDLRNQVQVLETIAGFASTERITVIMTLHDPNHAYLYSDQIVLMRKRGGDTRNNTGNIISVGHPDEVMTPERIHEAYGIHVDLVPYRRRNIIVPAMGHDYRERLHGS